MTFSVSHWSGRLGNNIQQVANCIMAAEKNGGTFEQRLDHDIISKFTVSFGDSGSACGRFYSWEALVHCEHQCYEGGNEIGVGVEHVYRNMRRICHKYIRPNLKLPSKESIGEDTIVMHLRSGDNYHRVFDPPTNYVPNPLIYYLNLINSFDKATLITESDMANPLIRELLWISKLNVQKESVAEDFATLMSAKNVALSGVGTFAMAAALCSSQIENLYTTDLLLTEHLNYTMLYNTNVNVHVMELDNYIPVFPCSWKNTDEQRQFILNYR